MYPVVGVAATLVDMVDSRMVALKLVDMGCQSDCRTQYRIQEVK